MVERSKDRMKEWINCTVRLESREHGSSAGTIQHGIRKPIAPQTDPLIACEVGSREPVGGVSPQYYFVSTEHEALKIPLSRLQLTDDLTMKARARSAGYVFEVTIRRKS
jgi:hypothetical protein